MRKQETKTGNVEATQKRGIKIQKNFESVNHFFVSFEKEKKTSDMRNKKKKGDGGAAAAAAAAAATTASPSGASNTSCYLQVRERSREAKAREKREKLFFFSTRNECIEKKYKPPHSSVSRSMPSQGHIWKLH